MIRAARAPLLLPLPQATPPGATPAPVAGAPPNGYPMTRKDDVKDTLHGTVVNDPYRWLEDAKAPSVQEWMKAEDTAARAELAKLPERDAIAARLKQLFYIDSLG